MPGFAASLPMSDAAIEAQSAPGFIPAPVPFWDSYKASLDDTRTNQLLGAREDYLADAYRKRDDYIRQQTGESVIDPGALAAMQLTPGQPQTLPDIAGSPDYEARIDALRIKYPGPMAAVETGEQLRARVGGELNALAARSRAGAQQQPVASFLGGATGNLADPAQLGAMMLDPAAGAPIAARMLAQSALWGGVAAAEVPGRMAQAQAVGGPAYGGAEALQDIGAGLAVGPVFVGGGALAKALLKPALEPVAARIGALLRTPEGEAERGAVNVLDLAHLDAQAVGPLRAGGDFDAGVAALARGEPAPPIEPDRDLTELFGEVSPPPGPALDTAARFAGAPDGAALFEAAEYRGRQIYAGTFDPARIGTDAATFQYKDNADAAGLTDRLRGVQAWDPTSSGKVIVYEGGDGRLTIADGHQRLGLANRLEAAGFEPRLDGYLFRAADGWSPQDVRVIAALKNIREGAGTPLDAAKVFREAPGRINDDSLPVSGDFMRQAKGLARLSDDAFGMVVNKALPERYGALIGTLAGDRPDLHAGLARLVRAGEPANMDEAHALVQEGLQDEWIKGQGAQGELFGASPAQSVAIGRAKLRAWLLKSLRGDTRLFGQLVRHADAIEAGGNQLARDANEASLAVTNTALEQIAKLGMRAGELGDAMNAAAREVAGGARPAEAGKGILARVKSAISNGEKLDLGRQELLEPPSATPPTEAALKAFDAVGGKGQADQIAAKPEDAAIEGGGRPAVPEPRAPRRFGIPNSAERVSTFDKTRAMTAHADYAAAKGGDRAAARALVAALVPAERAAQVRAKFGPDVTYVPVRAIEASGRNRIPAELATRYAGPTGKVDTQIIQANRVFHTKAGGIERLAARARFDGPVQAGTHYVLVDDVTTMGGTLAELANHIREGGGEVDGIANLVDLGREAHNEPAPAHLAKLEQRYGPQILERLGIEPGALTADEARYLATTREPDILGAGLDAARGGRGPGVEPGAGGERGGPGQLNEDERAGLREDAAAGDLGDFHPSLFEDIPGAEREDAALAHLQTCAPGE